MIIKVTGYLDTRDMDPDWVDEQHEMGVSSAGYEALVDSLGLDDVQFEAQR